MTKLRIAAFAALSALGLSATALAAPCDLLGGDADGDGICDDGNGSGTLGDASCSCPPGSPPGCTATCDDNCPWAANPTQLDTGRVGFPDSPDSIGDACQCFDVSNDGRGNVADVSRQRRVLQGQPPPLPAPQKCPGYGPGSCDAADVTVLRDVLRGAVPVPPNFCPAAGSCSSSADCPAGSACDPVSHQCEKNDGQACVQNSQCVSDGCCSQVCQDLGADPSNCGACGNVCALPNASEMCSAGTCGIGACDVGFFDCNVNPLDGCEVEEGAAANAPPGENLGSFPSDSSSGTSCLPNTCSPVVTRNGTATSYFTITAQEASSCDAYVGMRLDLTMGPDVDFDLYVSGACSCFPYSCSSENGAGETDTIQIACEDDPLDNGFTAQIEVIYFGGADSCQPWTLTVSKGGC